MRKILVLSLLSALLVSCDITIRDANSVADNQNNTEENNNVINNENNTENNKEFNCLDYGAFLGRCENNISNFNEYKYISLELDEFTDTNVKNLSNNGVKLFAYLNVGSLENYRDYYNQFSNLTFLDYDNWPDERWIDVSNSSWQNFIINNVAKDFKDRGAYGVYLDNVDVYSIAKEEGKNYSSFATALKNIIKGVSNLGLKIMMNGGAEFLDDLNDKNDNIFDYIWAYHQEEVFSLIDDYDNDVFTTQEKEDKAYYQEIAKMMKNRGKEIFFLEYTKNNSLINEIKSYCNKNKYHCYISNNTNLQ